MPSKEEYEDQLAQVEILLARAEIAGHLEHSETIQGLRLVRSGLLKRIHDRTHDWVTP